MSLKTKSTIKYASPIVREIDDFSQLDGLTGQYDKQQLSIVSFLPNGFIGGGKMFWDASQLKSGHDGDFIISPTVPWTLTYADYQAGTGETDPAGAGCWVRVGRAVGNVYEPSVDAPTGAIIQRGSNANGEFVRWADGTQRCYSIGPFSGTLTLQNTLYLSPVVTWTFPVPFISPPSVPHSGGSANVMTMAAGDTLADQVSFYAVRTFSSAAVGLVSVSAIGRWYS